MAQRSDTRRRMVQAARQLDTARTVLAARKAAPEDTPFLAADLDW